jgi:ABC-2 type transport system ATP-binding protein
VLVAIDTPNALKATIGTDRIELHVEHPAETIDALRDRFGIDARLSEGTIAFHVTAGEEFVPRLFAELGQPVSAIASLGPPSTTSL